MALRYRAVHRRTMFQMVRVAGDRWREGPVAMKSALIRTELVHSRSGGRAMHAIVRSLDLSGRSALRTMGVLGNRRAQPPRVPSPGPEVGRRSSDHHGHDRSRFSYARADRTTLVNDAVRRRRPEGRRCITLSLRDAIWWGKPHPTSAVPVADPDAGPASPDQRGQRERPRGQ